jgi:hypothetical protein
VHQLAVQPRHPLFGEFGGASSLPAYRILSVSAVDPGDVLVGRDDPEVPRGVLAGRDRWRPVRAAAGQVVNELFYASVDEGVDVGERLV